MKTTINIPEQLLKDVMELSGSKTISGAVQTAMESYHHRERQRQVIAHLGTLKGFMTQQDLREGREERDKRHDDRRQQLVDRGTSRSGRSASSRPRRKSA